MADTGKQTRKIKHNQLKETQERLALILDHAGEGIYGLDLAGKTTFANRAALRIVGYTMSEMLNVSQHALIHHHYPDGTKYLRENCNIYQAFKDGKIHTEDKEVFWHKDGHAIPIEYTSTPIRDNEENITGAVVVFKDISERKQAEAEREHLMGELEEINAELEQFAYIASHDLKAPLRGIDNLSVWIEEDLGTALKGDVKKNLGLLRGRVKRLEKLLDNLLAYSRAGRDLDLETVDLNTLIDGIVDLLDPPKEFTVKTEGPLPKIRGNKAALEMVFTNLINNALKHHDKKEGEITISVASLKGFWEFSVSDDGSGIPKEFHEKVLQMFQKLESRDSVEGSGIGLAIVNKVIKKQGGSMKIISQEGTRGTTFVLTWKKKPSEGKFGERIAKT